jgi:hypothetical protein
MKGKTNEEIEATRELAINKAKEMLGEDVVVIDSFFKDAPHDARPLWYLGQSFLLLATADVAFFAAGWNEARGCKMEHEACVQYGVKLIEEIEPNNSKKVVHTNYSPLKVFLNDAAVGDIIKVKFKDGKEYEIVKYHDGVIGTRDCPFSHVMNEDWDKEADWNTCDMKPFIEKWFDDNAPDELKELCSVTIPSATNIFGDKYKGTCYNDDESEIQWDYFKDWHNRIKTILNESANEEGWWYWTKSKHTVNADRFVLVGTNGSANNYGANDTLGVALCFLKK